MSFLPALDAITRNDHEAEAYTPRLLQLTEAEIDRLEKEREREARRKRRQTRGRRGVNLPDREPQKTQRTPAVYGLQNPMLDANGLPIPPAGYNLNSGSTAGAGISTRRAAAAAATANIAPSAASTTDFDTPQPTQDPAAALGGAGYRNNKRQRQNNYAPYFVYPGGLGRSNGPSAPRFAPLHGPDGERPRSPPVVQAHHPHAHIHHAHSHPHSHAHSHSHSHSHAHSHSHHAPPKEAKPPQFVLPRNVRPEDLVNQHPCIVDGMWHCSNCGIPGSLAPGRRKGPLGDKSLCGPCGMLSLLAICFLLFAFARFCEGFANRESDLFLPSSFFVGKFYHRHRRVKPCNYTRDEVFHMKQQQMLRSLNGTAGAGGGGGGGEMEDSTQTGSAADTPRLVDGAGTAGAGGAETGEGEGETGEEMKTERAERQSLGVNNPTNSRARSPISRGPGSPDLPFQEVGSPDDSESSRSTTPPPTTARSSPSKRSAEAAFNGGGGRHDMRSNSGPVTTVKVENPSANAGTTTSHLTPEPSTLTSTPGAGATSNVSTAANANITPPKWLNAAAVALRARYPNDRFEVQLRPRPIGTPAPLTPEWRVRCLDCPIKVRLCSHCHIFRSSRLSLRLMF